MNEGADRDIKHTGDENVVWTSCVVREMDALRSWASPPPIAIVVPASIDITGRMIGRPVQVRVLRSLLNGDEVCQFEIILPEDLRTDLYDFLRPSENAKCPCLSL
jgi:hypothetical protein